MGRILQSLRGARASAADFMLSQIFYMCELRWLHLHAHAHSTIFQRLKSRHKVNLVRSRSSRVVNSLNKHGCSSKPNAGILECISTGSQMRAWLSVLPRTPTRAATRSASRSTKRHGSPADAAIALPRNYSSAVQHRGAPCTLCLRAFASAHLNKIHLLTNVNVIKLVFLISSRMCPQIVYDSCNVLES